MSDKPNETGGYVVSGSDEPTEHAPTRRSAFLAPYATKRAVWPGTESLAPIAFVYRPLNAIESGAFIRDLQKANDVLAVKMRICAMLAKQIVTWDLTDENGQAVPVSEAVLLRQLDDLAVNGLQKLVEESTETLEDAAKN